MAVNVDGSQAQLSANGLTSARQHSGAGGMAKVFLSRKALMAASSSPGITWKRGWNPNRTPIHLGPHTGQLNLSDEQALPDKSLAKENVMRNL
jgi:hypothetical protein